MTDYERDQAIEQGHMNAASEAYFEPRPHLHNDPKLLNLFGAGFYRGWDAGRSPLLERIAALEAKLAQRVPDTDCPRCKGSEVRGFKRGVKCSACDGTGNAPEAAPAAPEQQEPKSPCACQPGMMCNRSATCADEIRRDSQAPNAQQADNWQHLKGYGYAPGGYMSKCLRCNHVVCGLDKRATSCKPCAERAAQQAEAQEPCAPAQLEAGAKKLAELCDYPWEHMPQQGRQTMRDNIIAILLAIESAKNGVNLK